MRHSAALVTVLASAALAGPAAAAAPAAGKGAPALLKIPLPDVRKTVATGAGLTGEQAMRNALVAAVEQVVGVLVEAEDIVDANDTLQSKIITATNAFVAKRTVVKRWQTGGLHYCRLVAHVQTRVLRQRLRAHNIRTVPIEGENLDARIETEQLAKAGAAEIIKLCLADLPQKVLFVREAGKAVPISSSRLRVPIEIGVDTRAYAKLMKSILPKLDKVARLRVTGGSKYRKQEPGPDLYVRLQNPDLAKLDKSPVKPQPGRLQPKLWFRGTRATARDETGLITSAAEKAAKAGQKLAFITILSEVSSLGTAKTVVYGVDEEAVQALPRTRRSRAVVSLQLLDADGAEIASTEIPYRASCELVLANARARYARRRWQLISVAPGGRHTPPSTVAHSWFGYAYIDVGSDDVKRIKTMKLSARWAAE